MNTIAFAGWLTRAPMMVVVLSYAIQALGWGASTSTKLKDEIKCLDE